MNLKNPLDFTPFPLDFKMDFKQIVYDKLWAAYVSKAQRIIMLQLIMQVWK